MWQITRSCSENVELVPVELLQPYWLYTMDPKYKGN